MEDGDHSSSVIQDVVFWCCIGCISLQVYNRSFSPKPLG